MPAERTPERVLAIYAHPDDPEVACGGTLARWAAEGASVRVLICTRGEKGTADPDADPAELAQRRWAEVEAAAGVLGVEAVDGLGLGDGELVNDMDLRGRLVAAVRSAGPEVVLGPDPTAVFFGSTYVNHVDHREVGFAVLDACAPAAASPLYFPEAGAAHQVSRVMLSATLEPDTWVDISGHVETKARALACHSSQIAEIDDVTDLVSARAAAAGSGAGLPAAEAFRTLRLGP